MTLIETKVTLDCGHVLFTTDIGEDDIWVCPQCGYPQRAVSYEA